MYEWVCRKRNENENHHYRRYCLNFFLALSSSSILLPSTVLNPGPLGKLGGGPPDGLRRLDSGGRVVELLPCAAGPPPFDNFEVVSPAVGGRLRAFPPAQLRRGEG